MKSRKKKQKQKEKKKKKEHYSNIGQVAQGTLEMNGDEIGSGAIDVEQSVKTLATDRPAAGLIVTDMDQLEYNEFIAEMEDSDGA